MNKSTFCILPFIHLEARADGFVAPCCMSQGFYEKAPGEPFHLSQNTLNEVWGSDSINSLRSNLINGVKDERCKACWLEESVGRSSKRIRENSNWKTSITLLEENNFTPEPPNFLDLKLGNTCNLKCRICGPHSSSAWVKEWKDVVGHDLIEEISSKVKANQSDKKLIMSWPDVNEKFWVDISDWLPAIRKFEIYGGEPFLIRQHFDLLKKSVELGYSKNQEIHYNSNGTVFPENAIKNIWPHFKKVHVMLSIDGIDEQFEYQRNPAKWNNILENIQKFRNVFSTDLLHICLTVSSINAYYVPEYLKKFHEIGVPVWVSPLFEPSVFCMKNLPQNAKDAILERWALMGDEKSIVIDGIDPLKSILSMPSDEKEFAKLVPTLRKHDAYRNESYEKVFPEFAKLISY